MIRLLSRTKHGLKRICTSRIGQTEGECCLSSQAGDGSTIASTDILKSKAKRKDPFALFPWRHEATIPPRLHEREKTFQNDWVNYEWSAYYVSTLTGKVYLDLPLLTSIGQGWRNELAESCAWAFTEGVNEIVSNVYKVQSRGVPPKDGDSSINFDFNHSKRADEVTETTVEGGNGQSKNSIMQEKLYNIYETARLSGKDQIQVHLVSQPTDAKLHSLHSLPMLSRSYVEKFPERVEEYEKIRSPGSRSFEQTNMFAKRMLEEMGAIETTLFAEVLVYCDEVFRVTDLQSGTLIQGHEDGKIRQVIHGVRVERVIYWAPGKGKTKSNWLITDLDDLLDGNQWYTPSSVGHKWWLSG